MLQPICHRPSTHCRLCLNTVQLLYDPVILIIFRYSQLQVHVAAVLSPFMSHVHIGPTVYVQREVVLGGGAGVAATSVS